MGFEPNPSHEETLKKLSKAYQGCDWNVKIFTKTAVSDQDGQAYFYTDHEPEKLEWGGNIIGKSNNHQALSHLNQCFYVSCFLANF